MLQQRLTKGQVAQAVPRVASTSPRRALCDLVSIGETFGGSSSRFFIGRIGQRFGLSRISSNSTRTGTPHPVVFRPRGEENHHSAKSPTAGFGGLVNTRQGA